CSQVDGMTPLSLAPSPHSFLAGGGKSLVNVVWACFTYFAASSLALADSFVTNGPAVFIANPIESPSTYTNAEGKLLRRPVATTPRTNLIFDRFLPESLNYLVWTNVMSLTNGRDTLLWSERRHPLGWPKEAPIVK